MLPRFASTTAVTIIAIALVSAPTPALAADEVGKTGAATNLELLTPSADTYLQYHGRVVVASGTSSDEYRWGGVSCGTRILSDELVRQLVHAVNAGGSITPRFQLGQGDARCLVGFTVE
jgi:hypothetical protein